MVADLSTLLSEIDALKARFDAARPLPPVTLQSLREDW